MINWSEYGLKNDPYCDAPLKEGGELDVDKAFIGRDADIRIIDSVISSSNRACLTICGNVGIGKTSLANFEKFKWKNKTQKPLFSFRREIEANNYILNKKSFLIEILASVYTELSLIEPSLLKEDVLIKISSIVDFTRTNSYSGGFSVLGSGLNGGKDTSVNHPYNLAISTLEQYFRELLEFIKTKEIQGKVHSGLIVHMNNFDVVMKENIRGVINFFDEVRDILQTTDVYFFFLGPINLFKDAISRNPRVKGVFSQAPLQLKPLNKIEIRDALNRRLEILKSDGVEDYIKPVDDNVIFNLYDLYKGDIRLILSSIPSIVSEALSNFPGVKTITIDESRKLLTQTRMEEIKDRLSTKQLDFVEKIISFLKENQKQCFTQKEMIELTKLPQANISQHYIKPLCELGVIDFETIKNKNHYELTDHFLPLVWFEKEVFLSEENSKPKENTDTQMSLL